MTPQLICIIFLEALNSSFLKSIYWSGFIFIVVNFQIVSVGKFDVICEEAPEDQNITLIQNQAWWPYILFFISINPFGTKLYIGRE